MKSTNKGTELSLEHSGFERNENLDFYQEFINGWLEKINHIREPLKCCKT